MSHFTVAVITPSLHDLERLLAPFQENNMGDCPQEYLEFFDVEEEYQRSYESESAEYVEMEDGRLLSPYHAIFRVPSAQLMTPKHKVPTHLRRVQIPHREKYSTFDEYMIQGVVGYSSRDEKTGRWGYWENPNATWDEWQVGGRWSNMLLLHSGERANAAPIKDIFFIEQEQCEGVTVEIQGITIPAALAPQLENCIAEASQEWDTVMEGEHSSEIAYYIRRYVNKQGFLRDVLSINTYAVLTPDGVWHAPGEMGRFGIGSESSEQAREFSTSFYATFIQNADPEHFLVIVDFHI
ncbi:hypothetical protein SK066_10720 [Paenibacillus hunanensis]|uniref:hypothetical protein n=1 Tax=Paenibacillus hunanensis TaxID=539262 RepID=UPI002A69B1F5|nr:hypothetical protein [Paenibacillus hunanensis]WPP43369.1 hypothetical protein SK066_10720 [Paenibacillus hunanensis]